MKIAQVINSKSWGDISPESFNRGIGGREGALVRLAKEWAKLGHEVTNFVSTGSAQRFTEREDVNPRNPDATPSLLRKKGYHEYVSTKLAKAMLRSFPYDAVVAWECPSVFDDEEIREKQKIRLIHMQVAHLEEIDYSTLGTGIVALSPWARDFLIHDGVASDNWYVRPNGVDIKMYPFFDAMKDRRKLNIVYSSSPDRGLLNLLRMWPRIRSEYKGANLRVGYGVSGFIEKVKWSHNRIGSVCLDIEKLMRQPGVTDIGKIGQDKLAALQLEASLWIYPADTIQATETGCITAIENMAAGNPCIMSDADCLEDEFSGVSCIKRLPFDEDKWIGAIETVLDKKHNTWYESYRKRGRELAESRDWSKIAPTWINLFEENANAKD